MVGEFFLTAAKNIVIGYKDIFLSDFDGNKEIHPTTIKHFCPLNNWTDTGWSLIDGTTGEPYCNDSPGMKRLKCLAVAVATPLVQLIGQLANIANRIAKLISFAHFWYPSAKNYSFKARVIEFCHDLLRVVLAPMIYIGMQLASLYALVLPYDGGKLYASLERASYTSHLIAPCFQPEAKGHLFGGSLDVKDAW